MIAPEPGITEDPNLDYQHKQLLCIGLTVTYEKVTLTRKKKKIKILAKLYEFATSDSTISELFENIALKQKGVWVKCVTRTRTRVGKPALGFYESLKIYIAAKQTR